MKIDLAAYAEIYRRMSAAEPASQAKDTADLIDRAAVRFGDNLRAHGFRAPHDDTDDLRAALTAYFITRNPGFRGVPLEYPL